MSQKKESKENPENSTPISSTSVKDPLFHLHASHCLHGLDFLDDFIGELGALGTSSKVSSNEIALLYHLEQGRIKLCKIPHHPIHSFFPSPSSLND